MIYIIVNGTAYTDFIEASVTLSLETMANDFTFSASAVGDFPPVKTDDEIQILVDGEIVLTGYIGEIALQEEEGKHVITYTGRDKTGDFLDSQINVLDDIKASSTLTLKRIIELVIAHLGQDLAVVDNLSPAAFNEAEDIIAPEVGQSAFEFILPFAKKRQALLASTGEGAILITQSEPTDGGGVVQRLTGANDNNIISQGGTISASQRFNKYIRRGQLDPRATNNGGAFNAETTENQSGQAIDDESRTGRQNVVVESESYSAAQLANRAKWANQLAKAQGTRFTCTVKGHQKPNGGLWVTNTLAQVNSDVADINRKMLINTVTFSQGEGRATATTLEFVEANVYTINEKFTSQRPAGVLNDAFKSLG